MAKKKRPKLTPGTVGSRWTLTPSRGKEQRATLVAHYSANKVKLFVFRVMRPR